MSDAELDTLIATRALDAPSITISVTHSDHQKGSSNPAPALPSPSSSSSSPSCSPSPTATAAAAAAAATAAALAVAGRVVSPPPSSSDRSGGGSGKGGGKKRGAGGDRLPSSRPRGLQEADLRQLEGDGEGKPGGFFGKGMAGGAVLGKRAKKVCVGAA